MTNGQTCAVTAAKASLPDTNTHTNT